MMNARKEASGPYQKYHGDYKRGETMYCMLGSRDMKKTSGNATERYLKKILPRFGLKAKKDFDIGQNDGVRKLPLKLTYYS